MSGVRSYNCNNLGFEKKMLRSAKIIAFFLAYIRKISYLCIKDAKLTKSIKICGITIA